MGFQNTGIWLTVKPKCLTETETNESNKKMKWLDGITDITDSMSLTESE